jgi:ABC-2 type transport system permease protein
MRRVFAQVRKELTQKMRDRLGLVVAMVLPLFLMMLLGSAISLTVTGLPIVVQDLDNSPASRDFIDAFRASLTFHIVRWPPSRQPADAFLTNTARAALVIPEHFGRDMTRGSNSEVQLLVDATDANTARLVQAYAAKSCRTTGRRLCPRRPTSGCGSTRAGNRGNSMDPGFW